MSIREKGNKILRVFLLPKRTYKADVSWVLSKKGRFTEEKNLQQEMILDGRYLHCNRSYLTSATFDFNLKKGRIAEEEINSKIRQRQRVNAEFFS